MDREELVRITQWITERHGKHLNDCAYIGNLETEYDRGEHQHDVLVFVEKKVNNEDIARFPRLTGIIIYDQEIEGNIMINGPPSLNYIGFDEVRFVPPTTPGTMTLFSKREDMTELCDVFVGCCESVPLDALLSATSYPGASFIIEDSSLSLDSVTVEKKPDGSVQHSVDIIGWKGQDFSLEFVCFNVPSSPKVRIHECPNLCAFTVTSIGIRDGSLEDPPFEPSGTVSEISNLPLLETIDTNHKIVVVDHMPELTQIMISDKAEKNEATIVGLENCLGLEKLFWIDGFPPELLSEVAQLTNLKQLAITGKRVTNLNGCEFLVNLTHLRIGYSALYKELETKFRSGTLSDEELRQILWQIDPNRTSVTTVSPALNGAVTCAHWNPR